MSSSLNLFKASEKNPVINIQDLGVIFIYIIYFEYKFGMSMQKYLIHLVFSQISGRQAFQYNKLYFVGKKLFLNFSVGKAK